MTRDSVPTMALLLGTYLGIGVVVLTIAFRMLRNDVRNVLWRPVIPFLGMLTVVHAWMPIAELLAGSYTYQSSYSLEAHFASWVATLAGALSVVVGALVFEDLIGRDRPPEEPIEAPWYDRTAFLLLVVVPSLFACYKLYEVVLAVGYAEFLRDRIGYRAGVQGWSALSNMAAVVPGFYAANYFLGRKRWRSLLMAVGTFLVSAFLVLSTGSRNSVFLALVCVLFVGSYFSRRLPARRILAVVLLTGAGSLALAVYGQYRRVAAIDPAQGVVVSAEDLVTSVSGAFGNHELLLWQVDNPHELYLGETYLAGFAVFIPRRYWAEKPLGGGPRIKNQVDPNSYVVGRRGVSSLTTGFLVEAWMNFGLIGPIVVGYLWGVALAIVGRVAKTARSSFGIVIAAYLVVAFGVAFLYSEFLGWMARTIPITVGLAGALLVGRSLLTRARRGLRVLSPKVT